MRTKLMLEALAAWLALAAASGQACASIQSGANNAFGATTVSTTVANPMVADPEVSLDHGITTRHSAGKVPANGSTRANADVALLTSAAAARTRRVDAPYSNAAPDFSLPGADDLTPGRKNAYGAELKRRAAFNRHQVGGASQPQGVLVAARGGSDLDAEKFFLIANAKFAPEPAVP